MDQSTVSYYCSLDVAPRPHTLRHISERLGINIAELTNEREAGERGRRQIAKTATSQVSKPDQPYAAAMKKLKMRWKKKTQERDTIRHLIAALFPDEFRRILAWLEQE